MGDTESSAGGTVVGITNKLADAIDVYDVFNPGTQDAPVPFTYTKLGSIKAGASGKVTTIRNVSMLQAMYTGIIPELNSRYYYQFPIKVMSATQFSFGTPPPLSYTIENSDRTSMIQSFLFHKFAMANPNSALAKSLNSAIKKGDVDSINAFFSNTKNFSTCTLASWNAVMNWLQMFTSGWQGPYYLYETAPSPMPSNYLPVLVATLNIESNAGKHSATLNLCSEDKTGQPVFSSPPQTTTIVMNGDGTMGDKNPGNDVPVTLTPVWMNVIQTTMKDGVPVSSYVSGPAVTGTVAGQKVVSSQTPRQLPKKTSNSPSTSTSNAATFDSIFNKLCQTVGLVVGLLMLFEMMNKKTNKSQRSEEEEKSKAESKKDFEDKKEAIEKETASEISDEYSQMESKVSNTSKEISDSYSETSEILQKNTMTEVMEKEANSMTEEINTQLENGMTPTNEFEKAFSDMETSFKEVQNSIDNNDFSKASETLSKTSEKIESTLKETGSEMHQWESKSLNDSSEVLKDAATQAENLNEAQNEYEENMENETNDSGFNEENESMEPDAVEIPEAV